MLIRRTRIIQGTLHATKAVSKLIYDVAPNDNSDFLMSMRGL